MAPIRGASHARGTGGEAWFLCPGGELATTLAAFAEALPAFVLAQDEPECARFGSAFAEASVCALELVAPAQLVPVLEGVEGALARAPGRLLCLFDAELVTAVVAHALGLPESGARALRVDPGRAFLLRDERIGLVLRHANVCGPEREPGTRLPLWKSAP